jgi:hypothetical protein
MVDLNIFSWIFFKKSTWENLLSVQAKSRVQNIQCQLKKTEQHLIFSVILILLLLSLFVGVTWKHVELLLMRKAATTLPQSESETELIPCDNSWLLMWSTWAYCSCAETYPKPESETELISCDNSSLLMWSTWRYSSCPKPQLHFLNLNLKLNIFHVTTASGGHRYTTS